MARGGLGRGLEWDGDGSMVIDGDRGEGEGRNKFEANRSQNSWKKNKVEKRAGFHLPDRDLCSLIKNFNLP